MSTTKISIELGDIIKINSPNNTDVHHKIFLVKYLDNNVLELIHHKTLKNLHHLIIHIQQWFYVIQSFYLKIKEKVYI